MTGTIRVSVVGLLDLPKAGAGASSFTLKVALGKREYQSMGQCDCSVPLVSLRGNLIVVLHDLEGNEIFKTEFRTISVVENGLVENSYPLESGGYVQMKLQFSLSPEERMLIREKRESALKRKRDERLQAETKSSLSGSSVSLGHTAATQRSEQLSELRVERDGRQLMDTKENNMKMQLLIDDGVNKSQVSSEASSYPQSETRTERMASGSSAPKENQTRSNVKKMVTAFESSLFQAPDLHLGPRIKSSPRRIEMGVSLAGLHLEESDADKSKYPQIISKSFSSGTLSDVNSQWDTIRSVFLQKQGHTEHVDHAERLQSESEAMLAEETVDSVGCIERGNIGYGHVSIVSKAAEISTSDSDAMPSSHNDEDPKGGSQDVKIEAVKIETQSSRIEQSDTLSIYQHGSLLNHADEEIASATPNGAVNFISYSGDDGCPCGNQDLWTSRRLCITTGSSQLRDLAGCCCRLKCGGRLPLDNISSTVSDDQRPDDDDDDNVKSSCQSVKTNHENSVGVAKLNRGLIEQGVRIAIVLAACGALVFNTRHR